MKILIGLGHPAHYHLFKNISKKLKDNGNQIYFAITPKDVLENLLIENNEEYYILDKRNKNDDLKSKLNKIIKSTKELLKFAKKNNIDIFIGCLTQIAYAGSYLHKPSIFLGEDDFNYTWLQGIVTYPYVTKILVPNVTNVGPFKYKKISYNGYHELAYLHPNNFTPDINVVKKYFSVDKPYFIIRFSKLSAYHDIGIKGINTEIAQKIIDILKPHGNIYITSERELEPQFEPYRIKINPLDMHHVMAFAQIFIGDSQTMSLESGVLGVPYVRFSGFIDQISVFRELDYIYQLGYGIKTNEVERLFQTIKELLNTPNLKQEWQQRREKMLSDKIDVTAFMAWFIENYPESAKIMKENPEYQWRFR